MSHIRTALLVGLLALPACATGGGGGATGATAGTSASNSENASGKTPAAYAQLLSPAGEQRGRAVLTDTDAGLRVEALIQNMKPGTYAIHIHQAGACTPPDFTSAGPHYNPTGAKHGFEAPGGPHKGDLPNVTVGADGTGAVNYVVEGVKLTGGGTALLDADGAAVVLHAGPDDYKTDPAGGSGARIACGPVTVG